MKPSAIFVYGTLKRGEINHGLVEHAALSIEPAWIRGQLYDLGDFPALVDGDTTIHGELVRISPCGLRGVLGTLDLLEGYDERRPETSMFIRRIVTAHTQPGNGPIAAEPSFAYFCNVDHPALPPSSGLLPVSDGCWRGGASTPDSGRAELERYRDHVGSFAKRRLRQSVQRGQPRRESES